MAEPTELNLLEAALAEEGDGGDADHGDEGHEERVLHERGATLGLATGLQPGAGEFVRGKHLGILP